MRAPDGATIKMAKTEFKESLPYWGGEAKPKRREKQGFVKAFDPRTGNEVWSWGAEHLVVSSLLTTAGGLVFVGRATGEFMALDARSGVPLWRFQTGSGIHGSAVTYSVGDKQYVAVPSGWGGWMKGFAPELFGAPRAATRCSCSRCRKEPPRRGKSRSCPATPLRFPQVLA